MESIILNLFLQFRSYFYSVVCFDTMIVTPPPLWYQWSLLIFLVMVNEVVISQSYTSDPSLSLPCYHGDEMAIV